QLWPPGPEPGPALRANHRVVGGTGLAPDELAKPPSQGVERHGPGRTAGGEWEIATANRGRALSADVLSISDGGRAEDVCKAVRAARCESPPGNGGSALGAAQHAGVRAH